LGIIDEAGSTKGRARVRESHTARRWYRRWARSAAHFRANFRCEIDRL